MSKTYGWEVRARNPIQASYRSPELALEASMPTGSCFGKGITTIRIIVIIDDYDVDDDDDDDDDADGSYSHSSVLFFSFLLSYIYKYGSH